MDTDQILALQDALPLSHCAETVQQVNGTVNGNENNNTDQVTQQETVPAFPQVYHVEVLQSPCSTVQTSHVTACVKAFLTSEKKTTFGEFTIKEFTDPFLAGNIVSISLTDIDQPGADKQVIDLTTCDLRVHVFQLHTDGAGTEEIDEENLAAATHWLLPSMEFQGLWESLVYDEHIKWKLLNYASTMLMFSDKGVDKNIVAWNRVVLLHGPPGSGKTSLCKALAQKLCIQFSHRYSHGQLVEINSHSLFSKWFSESGKLVMKMFQKIQELIEDPEALVCVLIDEVESLSAARKSSLNGVEPSDSVRVVNALLTQLDQLQRFPNVLVLTTSNITGAIDLAFVDRADIRQYIGPPGPKAIYTIFLSCVRELMQKGIISPSHQLMGIRGLEVTRFMESGATQYSLKLYAMAIKAQSLSGRTLRKLPFMAHSLFLQGSPVSLEQFLDALSSAVDRQFQERADLTKE